MSLLDSCTPYRCGTFPQFISSEKGCKHLGKNQGCLVRQYKVDGQVISSVSSDERCDFLLLNDDKRCAYYIELKGSDLTKAMRQIDNSVRLLESGHPGYAVYRRIIYHTGSHDVNSSSVTRWKHRHGTGNVVIKSKYYEEII